MGEYVVMAGGSGGLFIEKHFQNIFCGEGIT